MIVIAGPTAAGKSEVAMLLAERFNGEIISVDSMQVYRGLDIGTAKPSACDRARVPHHLIDILDLKDGFDAAMYSRLSRTAVADIQSRGRAPILCGGTGLYFKAFEQGLGDSPPSSPRLRAELEAVPLPELLRELAERDPKAHEKIDRKNPRRVIRAIEVIRLTGKPFSEQRANWSAQQSGDAGSRHAFSPTTSFGLLRSSSDLHQRIESRVDEMFRTGLVAETAKLLEAGLAQNKIAMQALGYRQVIEHLQGKRSLEETVELAKIRTRQFAKRQMTWFRRQMRLHWVKIEPVEPPKAIAEKIIGLIGAAC
jgi:tRNA dimethylallyltransferase